MTDTEIFEDLKRIIHKQFNVPEEDIEEDSYFDEDLNITEIELEDLAIALEEKYNIKIDPNKLTMFKKVSDMVSYLYENVDIAI